MEMCKQKWEDMECGKQLCETKGDPRKQGLLNENPSARYGTLPQVQMVRKALEIYPK